MRRLVTVLLLVILIVPPIPLSEASEKKHYWKGLVFEERGWILVGPFNVTVWVSESEGGYVYNAEVWLGPEKCATLSAPEQIEFNEKVVKMECTSGPSAFKLRVYGQDSRTLGPGKIKVDIIDSVYSPEVNMSLWAYVPPESLRRNETRASIEVSITVLNTGDRTPDKARLTASFGVVEGNESLANIWVTTVSPAVDKPENFTFSPPLPGKNKTFVYEITADSGGKLYANFSITFSLIYESDFEIESENETTVTWVYSPGTEVVKTKKFYFSVGEYYREVGVPDLRISLNHSLLQVEPGDTVDFEFVLRNRGTGDAFNISIWLGVSPELPTITLTGPDIPGLTGKPFTGRLTTPLTIPKMPKNSRTPVISFAVTFPPDVYLSPGSVYTVTIDVEWYDKLGNYFSTSTNVSITPKEPEVPSIEVSKMVNPETVPVNGTITVLVVVRNVGDGPAYDVHVVDEFPEEYFSLVQGQTAVSLEVLAPNENATMSYRLMAIKEGVVTLPPAQVDFKIGGEIPQTEFSNSDMVSIVRADVKLEVLAAPPSLVVTEDTFELRFVLTNEGTGQARDLIVSLEAPKGIDVLEVSEGGVFARTEEGGWRIDFPVDSLDPGASVTFYVRMSALTQGVHHISLLNATYAGPMGVQRYGIGEADRLEVSLTAVIPFTTRAFLAAVFFSMIVAVGAAVIVAFRETAPAPRLRRLRRPRLGAY